MMKRKIGRRALWVAAALGLLGLVLAVESYRQFHSALAGEGTWCSFGEISSCEKAFQSEYSTLFGRPIALYGGVAYFLVAAIALVGLLNGGPYVLASLFHLALLSIPLLIATLYFGWALSSRSRPCVSCVSPTTSSTSPPWWWCGAPAGSSAPLTSPCCAGTSVRCSAPPRMPVGPF
ncbi:MAG: vitamin K epoxide reductase family protein [Candidatus Omnitrophica bacterium]|nr:vitamin K epoxide reductase family protein [Candidatus Omnitrophota bacterium]